MDIKAGGLNKRLIIQYQVKAQDTFGAEAITWTTLDTVWGNVKPVSGKEVYRLQQMKVEADFIVTIRYRTGLDETMRVKFGSRYFEIKYIQNTDEAKVELVMYCKEVK
jgi:SPP1 family predicted phage head-tail adaptor